MRKGNLTFFVYKDMWCEIVNMLPSSSRPVLVCVGDHVFRVCNGASGKVEVQKAPLSGDFQPVKAANPPSNRFNQFCLPLAASSFLMLGGDGFGISSFEVWLFDTAACAWRSLKKLSDAPIARRSSHCAAAFAQDGSITVFVYGGVHGLELCRDVLVLKVEGDGFYADIVPEGDGWPCPRRDASIALCQGKMMMFGGENDEGVRLNDLWEFDAGLFGACPYWRNLANGGLPGRKLHQSWADGQNMFVAGGLGKDGELNDIWMWSEGAWQQTMIFVAKFPIFACELGLCEVSTKLEKVVQKSPFAALDGMFEELRNAEKKFSERRSGEERKLSLLRAQLNERRNQGAALDAYTGGEPVGNVKEALANFSQERREFLQEQIDGLRTEIRDVVKEIVEEYPLCVHRNIRVKRDDVEIAAQMALRLEEEKEIEKETDNAHKIESQIGESQTKVLKESSKGAEDVTVDPGDFQSFMRLANEYGIMSEKSQCALDGFYGMQLRAYHHLLTKVATRKEDIALAKKRIPLLEQKIAKLSQKLSRRFLKISEYQGLLDEWSGLEQNAKSEEKLSQQFLAEIEAQKKNESHIAQTVKRREMENEAVREKIATALVNIGQTNRATLESIWTKAHEIMTAIDDQTPSVATTTLASQAPALEELIRQLTNV